MLPRELGPIQTSAPRAIGTRCCRLAGMPWRRLVTPHRALPRLLPSSAMRSSLSQHVTHQLPNYHYHSGHDMYSSCCTCHPSQSWAALHAQAWPAPHHAGLCPSISQFHPWHQPALQCVTAQPLPPPARTPPCAPAPSPPSGTVHCSTPLPCTARTLAAAPPPHSPLPAARTTRTRTAASPHPHPGPAAAAAPRAPSSVPPRLATHPTRTRANPPHPPRPRQATPAP